MPYVNEGIRQVVDMTINELIDKINSLSEEEKEGTCNYTISRIVASSMKPKTGWRYISLSRAHEVFVAAGIEFYNRLLRPYENNAIVKNGDLDEYKNPGF